MLWRKEKCMQTLIRKHEAKGPLARLRHKQEDNTTNDLQETGARV